MSYLILIFSSIACAIGQDSRSQTQAQAKNITLTIDEHTVIAEVADDPAERQQGLMGREYLDTDSGMLFVYPAPKQLSFWMKNTPLPLSIAFIDNQGIIVNIAEMTPLSTANVPSVKPAQYGLEMESGWFESHGVTVGTKISGLP